MIKVTNNEYICSFGELLELQDKGYILLNDLKMAIEKGIVKERHRKMRLYINHESKLVDMFNACFCKEIHCFDGEYRIKYYLTKDRKNVILD